MPQPPSASLPLTQRSLDRYPCPQFGYVSLFSGAYPLAPLIYTMYNAIELRTDAHKICRSMRRPRYMGAESIGKWLYVLKAFAWLAIPVNGFLLAITDMNVRSPSPSPSP